jgi:hypothetical protein
LKIRSTAKFALRGFVVSLSVMLSACGLFNQAKPVAIEAVPNATVQAITPPTPPPKATALTAEAESVLKAAEQSAVEARIKRTLWAAANEQLMKARSAAKSFDSAATLTYATEVIKLCELSNKQLSDAPVTWQ